MLSKRLTLGANFGTIVSLPVSGWLCSLDFDGGWPLCFYLFGFTGIIWFAFWCFLVYNTPSSHPRINPQEKAFILASIAPQDEENNIPIPWLKIFTCVPLWAILITQCGQSWAFYTQLTELPTYMSQILHFDIQANAILSAIPYLTSWWCGILTSIFADWLLSRGYLSLSTSYKFFNSIGGCGRFKITNSNRCLQLRSFRLWACWGWRTWGATEWRCSCCWPCRGRSRERCTLATR
jgi:ACS family sodium-dependent inorganic phosphate cotransporter-like MFS transporter 5